MTGPGTSTESEPAELGGRVHPDATKLRSHRDAARRPGNPLIDRIVAGKIRFKVSPPDSLVDRAERFHRLTLSCQDERRGELAEAYRSLGGPETLVTMLCNQRYLPLLNRWVESCERRGIEPRGRTVVSTLDDETLVAARKLGLRSVPADPSRSDDIPESEKYGDGGFASVMLYKTLAVVDALTVAPRVLFQDVDVIWLRDPVTDLDRRPAADLHFMFDGWNAGHEPLFVNSGFFLAASTDVTRAVFDTLLHNSAYVLAHRSQQAPLNQILGHFLLHNVLDVAILPESVYLNGHLFNMKSGLAPAAREWARDGVVVHYSWTGTLPEKLDKLERFELR
ncbi:MAG: putative nucleotide-diphospho-sugar transferase [Acidimicrobiales bacterium]